MARPTKYKAEFAEQARKLCLLGATDADMAEFFEVDEATINRWKKSHKEFCESLKKGKTLADATVADRLFKRATGYEHSTVKIFNSDGEAMVVPYTERFAPDTTAAIFWLKNRRPEQWRDKRDMDLTSSDGTMSPTRSADDMTDDELATIIESRK